jgi:hypothetical protein
MSFAEFGVLVLVFIAAADSGCPPSLLLRVCDGADEAFAAYWWWSSLSSSSRRFSDHLTSGRVNMCLSLLWDAAAEPLIKKVRLKRAAVVSVAASCAVEDSSASRVSRAFRASADSAASAVAYIADVAGAVVAIVDPYRYLCCC